MSSPPKNETQRTTFTVCSPDGRRHCYFACSSFDTKHGQVGVNKALGAGKITHIHSTHTCFSQSSLMGDKNRTLKTCANCVENKRIRKMPHRLLFDKQKKIKPSCSAPCSQRNHEKKCELFVRPAEKTTVHLDGSVNVKYFPKCICLFRCFLSCSFATMHRMCKFA